MKKIWVRKIRSFKEAQRLEADYYARMSPQERLATVQFLREMYYKIHHGSNLERSKRLRRSVRIIKQK